jgi:hypothetical protein
MPLPTTATATAAAAAAKKRVLPEVLNVTTGLIIKNVVHREVTPSDMV